MTPSAATSGRSVGWRAVAAVFEQLDQQARLVLEEAALVAHRLAHHYIGTEHLLVGLAVVEGGAQAALSACGLSAQALEHELAELLGRGRAPLGVQPPLTSTAALALERARWHARQQSRTRAADVDLLLAVVQLADSTAATVLRGVGVEPAAVEAQLSRTANTLPQDPVADPSPEPSPNAIPDGLLTPTVSAPPPRSLGLDAVVEELNSLRQETIELRAEVARLRLLVEGR
ncbi:MAG: Clp protease N-terminal domain-containing protein [Acidimicrobiales bacterium]